MYVYTCIKSLQSQTESVSAARPVAVGEKLVQSSPDKIEKARQAKEDGNAAFKAGEYRTAIKKYHHALMYTKGVVSQGDLPAIPGMEQMTKFIATDEEKATASELTVTICNNLAGGTTITVLNQSRFFLG